MLTSDTAENISPQHNNYLAERTNRLKFNINALLSGEGPICLHWPSCVQVKASHYFVGIRRQI